MTHKLIFEDDEKKRKVIDANVQELDRYEIYDPRNPLTKRRRENSKQTMKEKKKRTWRNSQQEMMTFNRKILWHKNLTRKLTFNCFDIYRSFYVLVYGGITCSLVVLVSWKITHRQEISELQLWNKINIQQWIKNFVRIISFFTLRLRNMWIKTVSQNVFTEQSYNIYLFYTRE